MKKRLKYETPGLVNLRDDTLQGTFAAECNDGFSVYDCGNGSCVNSANCNLTGNQAAYCQSGSNACSTCVACCYDGDRVTAPSTTGGCTCIGYGNAAAYWCGTGFRAYAAACSSGSNVGQCPV
ncbi:MAG: hypothetical protein A4E73_03140 [Syntrophaceae bacterium PtaU1.Bin231]|jgi:hypothetical protein|nr:MAG: hypothetical protein A4E67_01639 [Syntrophaceae bacterium PtaB.Bin038]OPY89237.1 MAG: hypothetical protein A4E73_03140 [Syntrophaceae bacterium PtaU1.Bin231]